MASSSVLYSIYTQIQLRDRGLLRIVFLSVESVLKLLNYIYYIFN